MSYQVKIGEYVFSGIVKTASRLEAVATILVQYGIESTWVLFNTPRGYRGHTENGLPVTIQLGS